MNLLPYDVTGEKTGSPHEMLFWRFGQQIALRMGDLKIVKGAGSAGVTAADQHFQRMFAFTRFIGLALLIASVARAADLPKTDSSPCTKPPVIDGVLGIDEWKNVNGFEV